jgi:hypothetical protein
MCEWVDWGKMDCPYCLFDVSPRRLFHPLTCSPIDPMTYQLLQQFRLDEFGVFRGAQQPGVVGSKLELVQ